MKKDLLIKELRNSIADKAPVDYFNKLTDVLDLLFNKISSLEKEVAKAQTNAALAIKWDPIFASDMISNEITSLRNNNADFYKPQIDELKKAYREDLVTQSYEEFCQFWIDVLGVHPFIVYKDKE